MTGRAPGGNDGRDDDDDDDDDDGSGSSCVGVCWGVTVALAAGAEVAVTRAVSPPSVAANTPLTGGSSPRERRTARTSPRCTRIWYASTRAGGMPSGKLAHRSLGSSGALERI